MPAFGVFSMTLICMLLTASCHRKQEMVDTSFVSFYKASGIHFSGVSSIEADCEYDAEFDNMSRLFYQANDTSLCFRKIKTRKEEHKDVCAIDWRMVDFDVITLIDYDKDHPAGSSLKDVLVLEYWYKTKRISIPLSEIKYGSMMLSDYYPFDSDFSDLYFHHINERVSLVNTKLEVRITDDTGRMLTAQSRY